MATLVADMLSHVRLLAFQTRELQDFMAVSIQNICIILYHVQAKEPKTWINIPIPGGGHGPPPLEVDVQLLFYFMFVATLLFNA